MELKQPKKLLIVNILDILRKYSDEEHRLSQREITELLESEYIYMYAGGSVRARFRIWKP